MSVILEFTIDSEGFELGQVLSGKVDDMHLEIERLVPTGNMVMPYVWATGDDHQTFQANVRSHPSVQNFLVIDTLGDSGLYRIEWVDTPMDLIEGIAESDAVVLEATGNGRWVFRLRFLNHDRLSQFHNYIIDHDTKIHIERTYTLTEATEHGYRFELSVEQREALVLALKRGYFESPREVSLDELADELGISSQAVSKRIRRGNQQILRKTLLGSLTDPG